MALNNMWLKAFSGVAAVGIALFISCAPDQSSGRDDTWLNLFLTPPEVKLGSISFYMDGEPMSRDYCRWDNEHHEVSTRNGNHHDWEVRIFFDENLYDESPDCPGPKCRTIYLFQDVCSPTCEYRYYYSKYSEENAEIHINRDDGQYVEGTFSGTICNQDNTSDCHVIENGVFSAHK